MKFEKRGIVDDINKCYGLHRLPEFDEIYVAAPKIFLSSDLIAFAKNLRIGVLGVKEDSIEWLLESHTLGPPRLSGGSNKLLLLGVLLRFQEELEMEEKKLFDI